MEKLINFLICVFEVIIFHTFFRMILRKKIQSVKKNFLIYCIAVFILGLASSLSDSKVNLLISILIYGCGCFILFDGGAKQKFFYFITFFTVFASVEIVAEFLLNYLWKGLYSWDKLGIDNRLIIIFLEKLLAFVILYSIGKRLSKEEAGMANKILFCSFFLPIATFCMFGTIFYSNVHQNILGRSNVFFLVGCILLLFANAIIFLLYDYIFIINQKRQELEITSLKTDMEKKYYDRIEKVNLEQIYYMHDIKNYLTVVGNLAISEDNLEIRSVIKNMQIKVEEMERDYFCNHKILNTILCEKKKEADCLDINYEVYIEPNVKIDFLKDVDVITIMGNLIDNAIEAAKKVSCGFIEINIFETQKGHFLIVKIENSYNGIIKKNGANFITTKESASKHGIGLANVKRSLENYAAVLQIKEEINSFIATVIFTI